jgi:hypothetical protein
LPPGFFRTNFVHCRSAESHTAGGKDLL